MDSVNLPIKRNSMGSGHVSHCWTSSFDNHLDDSFVVFKNVQLRLADGTSTADRPEVGVDLVPPPSMPVDTVRCEGCLGHSDVKVVPRC